MKRLFIHIGLLLLLPPALADNITRKVNLETGLSRWMIDASGVDIQLVPVTSEYIQAVFASRGLPQQVIDRVGSYCVFGTIIRNGTDSMLSNRLADWRYVTSDGVKHSPKTKSEWVSEWQEQGVSFRWLLLAEDQVYAPEDWGQGFTTVGLPPETEFDLEYSWAQDGEIHTGTIEGMKCAPKELLNE